MKILAKCLTALALVAGLATAEEAGANFGVPDLGSPVPCGFSLPAPNADEACSGWIASTDGGYVYKVDATHHIGWWGGNYDPGTWHTIVYLFTAGGSLVRQEANFDVGDDAHPLFSSNAVSHSTVLLIPWNAHYTTPMPNYRPCPPGGTIRTTVADTNPSYTQYGAGQFWPYEWTSAGNSCQYGYGTHDNWTHATNAIYGNAQGQWPVQGLMFN